jgi:hypothetical protein
VRAARFAADLAVSGCRRRSFIHAVDRTARRIEISAKIMIA